MCERHAIGAGALVVDPSALMHDEDIAKKLNIFDEWKRDMIPEMNDVCKIKAVVREGFAITIVPQVQYAVVPWECLNVKEDDLFTVTYVV